MGYSGACLLSSSQGECRLHEDYWDTHLYCSLFEVAVLEIHHLFSKLLLISTPQKVNGHHMIVVFF